MLSVTLRPVRTATPRRVGVWILQCLFCLALLAGLMVVGRAFRVTEGLSTSLWVIHGLLGLGALSLLGVLWQWLRAWRRPNVPRLAPSQLGTILRLLFEILILGAATFLTFFQPFERTLLDVAVGLAFSLWGALALACSRWPRVVSNRATRAVDLTLFNLCLFAALAEGSLRLVAHYFPSPLFAQVGQRSIEVIQKRQREHVPGHMRFGFPLNSLGHYDDEPTAISANKRRVVTIGDSFSFGIVPHHFHFTSVAERHSPFEVYNLGYPNIGPHEYLLLLQYQALSLEPDAIVVNLFIGNDVSGFRSLVARGGILRPWLDRDQVLGYQVPRRLLRLWRQRTAQGVDQPIGGLEGESIQRRLETVREMVATYPWLADPALEAPTFLLKGVFLDIESKRAERAVNPQQADYSALFEMLREMRRLADDVPFAIMMIPDEFQIDDELWAAIEESRDGTALSRDLPQQVLGEWLMKEKIPYLDLLPVLRSQCAPHHQGEGHCYHLRDTHFNARGNRLAGEELARFLTRLGSL